jgi:hypothetical protein
MILDAIHMTKEGDQCRVAEMETDHLLNTIRYSLRNLVKVVEASEVEADEYTQRLYGYPKVNINVAVDTVETVIAKLTPYIFEAFYRFPATNIATMEEIRQMLDLILKRDGRLITPAGLLPEALPSQEIWFDDDEDEQHQQEF